MPKTFEEYLREEHAKEYTGDWCDQNDAYEVWLQNLIPDFFILYADAYAKSKEVGVERIKKILQAFNEYIRYNGAAHEENCPCDDTCNCEYKPLNDKVNKAVNDLEALKAECGK